MRIELVQSGGLAYFPGLNRPLVLELERLDPAAAGTLLSRIEAADFFHLPARVGRAPAGAADCQSYRLTLEHEGRRHSIQALIPVQDPGLRALIEAIEQFRPRPAPNR